MAERQTRCLQVAVSLRAWGFKSPLAHSGDVPECRGHLFPKVPGQSDLTGDFVVAVSSRTPDGWSVLSGSRGCG